MVFTGYIPRSRIAEPYGLEEQANLALEYRIKQGKSSLNLWRDNALVIANTLFQQHKRRLYTCNTEIRLIIFFAAKDGEALYSEQEQDQELAVPQIMNSLLPNSDLN